MTSAQEILSAFPSDMEPEEWALVLPGLQSKMIEAEQSAAAFKEARNIAMERALDGAKELVIEGYKYSRVTKTTYSEVKLARDYPELVDSILTDLRLAYKPKITKAVIDKELAKLPEDRRLEIQRDILGDSEVSYTATAVKAAKGTKGVDA